jgi:hypothetical protein
MTFATRIALALGGLLRQSKSDLTRNSGGAQVLERHARIENIPRSIPQAHLWNEPELSSEKPIQINAAPATFTTGC